MNRSLFFSILFMFISPALSLYQGLKSRNPQYKKWILIFFVTFFGTVIMLAEGQDGYVHQQNVYEHYTALQFSVFEEELFRILTLRKNFHTQEDPYIHILSYFTGTILGLPDLFFVFVAFIYGYFFSGSIFRLFRIFPKLKYSQLFFGVAVVFLLWKSIEGINTVRTWTGLWVLFYGCLSYYQTKKKKYLLLMFAPPFIHVGYYAMAIPAWIVLFFGVRPLLYTIIFLLSFTTTLLNPTSVTQQLEKTDVGESQVRGYYVEEGVGVDQIYKTQDNKTWYRRFFKAGVQDWAVVVVAVSVILFGTYRRHLAGVEAHLFSIGILTKALSNATWFHFALENRSAVVAGLFILATVLLMWQRGYYHRSSPEIAIQKLFLSVGMVVFVPFIVYRLADIIYFVSAFLIAMPFIPWIDSDLNMSIRQAIGKILGV